ncbi:hypothetical protein INT43_003949 [Umbelopsis isabellina]|uniref:Purine nucleoside permease n=1 Tax=Mortierella isabellina TaxID=91625 RepID=A0A8H7PU63_MORIS|nr:hypothetical protein INT43_003949 [Umbelopsis isabellina]
MKYLTLLSGVVAAALSLPALQAYPSHHSNHGHHGPIAPKVMLITMFAPEQGVWLEPLKLVNNVTVPGLSPLFPHASCDKNYDVCLITTGEAEINAAVSVTSLAFSPLFDLKKTYFMIAGIAGINPDVATIGGVTFGRFAVQLELEYEIDAREMPSNFSTGYWGLGADAPGQYPVNIYGTEAINLAHGLKLNDSDVAAAYRKKFSSPANKYPSIVACDTGSSNAYWSGKLLGDSFTNYTKLLTKGKGVYCATAQEDNATLEALVRATSAGLVDFSRIVLMRSASDFDRPPPGETVLFNLVYAEQGAFEISLENLYIAGSPFVKDVVKNWHEYEHGVKPSNYIGNIFGTLGGKMDF